MRAGFLAAVVAAAAVTIVAACTGGGEDATNGTASDAGGPSISDAGAGCPASAPAESNGCDAALDCTYTADAGCTVQWTCINNAAERCGQPVLADGAPPTSAEVEACLGQGYWASEQHCP